MFESGIILGSIVVFLTCCLSVIACTFIIESLATQNCFLKDEMLILERASVYSKGGIINNNKFKLY